MPHLIRRAATLLALTTACASSPPPTAAPPAAHGKQAAPGRTHAFRIGALEAFALHDGDIDVANDGKTLGLGHAPGEVGELLGGAALDPHHPTLSIQPLLVKAGARVLLFDAGVAAATSWARGGHLLQALANAGVEPGVVTDVFISHAHPDHVGGLLTADGALAFPNARVHLSAPEWASMQASDEVRDIAARIAAQAAPFESGAQLLPEVRAVATPGHTPGHSAYLVTSADQSLFYLGDLAHHFVVSVERPSWGIAFDQDAPSAEAMRIRTLATLAREGTRVYAVHFPFPGVGHVRERGDTFVWEAEAP